jgi:thiol:disulfide interchange protein DsbC
MLKYERVTMSGETSMYFKSIITLFTLAISVNAIADTDAIKNSLQDVLPDFEVSRIQESQIPGLYMVSIGAEVIYVSANGQYLIRGDIIDLVNKNNLTEVERTVERVVLLKDIPKQDYIEFAPVNPQHTIYVFTDITCGFCQRLQADVTEINNKGIAIRFLAFPRSGPGTESSVRMESIWCAEDRKTALTDAMIGIGVREAKCQNPVNENFALGQAMGVRGTPAIFTEDGRYLPGYMPPEELLQAVSQKQ